MPKKAKKERTNRSLRTGLLPLDHLYDVHCGDARELSQQLPEKSISATVTSPPYFDLKDYGAPNQIGFGQDYDTYLDDLKTVFGSIYRATADDGSLWIIIDTFRRNQEVLPLPFDLAQRLKEVGWILRDIVIWKKQRTVPWTHKGTTKRIFEYILVFSKSKAPFKYFPDQLRDSTDLQNWWVRYPERYNPSGKALEEIWSYDIPRQGSWGPRYIRHFCPLPASLVSRIIQLTTSSNDVVLDPFAGTGTVPAQALLAGRRYIGFELNPKYIQMFRKHVRRLTTGKNAREIEPGMPTPIPDFQKTILDLRVLKYARLLYRAGVGKFGSSVVSKVLARPKVGKTTRRHKLRCAEYTVIVRASKDVSKVERYLRKYSQTPPLSKFGIEETIKVAPASSPIAAPYQRNSLFLYSSTNSHKFVERATINNALRSRYPVLSTIRATVEIPDG